MDVKLHIIYDDRRSEKYPLLLEQLIEQGITSYELYPAIIDKRTVVESINAGHKALVRMAKENKMPFIAIGEDDLMFTAPDAWQYFLNNMPKDFSVYVAATYIVPVSNNKLVGFHCYVVNSSFYDQFLSVPDNEHIDTAICNLNSNHKICYPFAALQRPGFSANNPGDTVNYNTGCGITEKDIYRG